MGIMNNRGVFVAGRVVKRNGFMTVHMDTQRSSQTFN